MACEITSTLFREFTLAVSHLNKLVNYHNLCFANYIDVLKLSLNYLIGQSNIIIVLMIQYSRSDF